MSEIKTLEIPKWGLSMEEGTIAQWLIKEGDSFNKGDEICEIETTKIVNVLEAPFAGTLRKILAKMVILYLLVDLLPYVLIMKFLMQKLKSLSHH